MIESHPLLTGLIVGLPPRPYYRVIIVSKETSTIVLNNSSRPMRVGEYIRIEGVDLEVVAVKEVDVVTTEVDVVEIAWHRKQRVGKGEKRRKRKGLFGGRML